MYRVEFVGFDHLCASEVCSEKCNGMKRIETKEGLIEAEWRSWILQVNQARPYEDEARAIDSIFLLVTLWDRQWGQRESYNINND